MVRVNFGASKFVYDIEAHDWSAWKTENVITPFGT